MVVSACARGYSVTLTLSKLGVNMKDYAICHSIGAIDGYNGMPYENPYDEENEYDAYEVRRF